MESFKDKIDRLIKRERLTNAQLAKELGISAPAFSNLKSKAFADVPYRYIDKLKELYDLNDDYFETITYASEPKPLYNKVNDDLWSLINEQSATIKEQSETIKRHSETISLMVSQLFSKV